MSVRHGLLTILTETPLPGYDVRREFEQRTGGTWPLNISQIYSTLQRLERDGLATQSDSDQSGATIWTITQAGEKEARTWWYSAAPRNTPTRQEVTIKVALAVTSPHIDTAAVVSAQRTETLTALRDYTRLKSRLGPMATLSRDDAAWSLLLDSYIFTLEAELRWLDHVESRIAMGLGAAHTATFQPSPHAADVASPPVSINASKGDAQ